ncbi:hypothetical protein LRY65_03625 [Candidatus Woesebacteria bacterium]|nr:hypothetical protein [Candidatus Woesebacteria bacterium]MCD8506982.1 hypothetical protein [Candidatus Woesebacteria bacterium]MCD8527273.1 hypothetical protein [Candidatus Woesebacteria bacterium]MCD8546639.1 hypothetical protein [Candidatus Woesebacteria bacterium]
MKFVPAILDDSPQFVQEELDRFATFQPQPERCQLDIIDGQFADNLTVEPGLVHSLETHGIKLDLHFMVVEPLEWLREIRDSQTVDTVIAQVERMTSIPAFIDEVKNGLHFRVGLSLDLYTPFSTLSPEVLSHIDTVQIMGNRAGFQGQSLHSTALKSIQSAAQAKAEHGYSYDISVDIGMNPETIPEVESAGATVAVVGSYFAGAEGAEHWSNLHE